MRASKLQWLKGAFAAVAIVAVAFAAGCGGETQSPAAEVGASEPAAGSEGADEPEADARIVFEEGRCSTTVPERWSSGEALDVELLNLGPDPVEFIIGMYDDGFGREDMLAYAEDKEGTPLGPPSFANDRMTVGVSGGDEGLETTDLEPGRYYVVCLADSFTRLIVLDDLVVE